MDRVIERDRWSWFIETPQGKVLPEAVHGTIGSIPTQMVSKIGLWHRLARLTIDFPRGVATLEGNFGRWIVRPEHPHVAVAHKIPIFFRRKRGALGKPGTSIVFRAIGFAALDADGRVAQINAIRVFDDRVESRYHTQWPLDLAKHTTGQGLILGV